MELFKQQTTIQIITMTNTSISFIITWVISTTLCIWFLFRHAPTHLSQKETIHPLVYPHLIGAYSIYLVCAHNTLLTPSTFKGTARLFHIWIGRIGLLLGVMGFITGAILVWFIYDYTENWGFSIGITVGGIQQMIAQYKGYKAIRSFKNIKLQITSGEYKSEELKVLQDEQDKNLSLHIENMVALFVMACGIPAFIRISEAYEINILILIGIANVLNVLMAKPLLNGIKTRRLTERNAKKGDKQN